MENKHVLFFYLFQVAKLEFIISNISIMPHLAIVKRLRLHAHFPTVAYSSFLKKRRIQYLRMALFLCLCVVLSIQNAVAQDSSYCAFVLDSTMIAQTMDTSDSGTDKLYVKIYIHIVRRDDGSGGLSSDQIKIVLENLDNDFAPLNIKFLTDCTFDYIDNTQHYNDVNGNATILEEGNHDDGIDLYLYPHIDPPVSAGNGAVKTTPDRELFIAGNFWKPPFSPLYQSSVTTHEMGHALGLYHTHQTAPFCTELIDGSNCGTCGDKICDTPADPKLNFDVDPNTCSWNTPMTDTSGASYTPDTLNFMSYTHVSCLKRFTKQQANVMRNNLKQDTFVSTTVFSFDYMQKTVDSSETWTTQNLPNNGVVTVGDKIVVEDGASLTIAQGVLVRFAPEASLVVEKGGKLTLYGTLTSFCGESWHGVQVEGDAFASQTNSNQGVFLSYGGAVVENAEIGVRAWGAVSSTTTGGIINCSNTTFRNNLVGVALKRYPHNQSLLPENYHYKGTFTLCTFETTSDWPHDQNFRSFLDIVRVTGINIKGSAFRNGILPVSADNTGSYGYGIYSSNASFYALPWCSSHDTPCSNETQNSFKGLGFGIYMEMTGSMPMPITINRANFEECIFGIHNRGYDGVTITECDFTLGKLPDTQVTTEQVGIIIENPSTPYTIAKNNFIGVSGNALKFGGIQTTNTGDMNNVIKDNRFTDLTHGNTIYGRNGSSTLGLEDRGLSFECNENLDNTFFDFIVDDHPQLSDLLRKNQRRLINPSPPRYEAAGNSFSYFGSGAGDFVNNGQDTVYYFYNSNGDYETPLNYNSLLVPVTADTNRSCFYVQCLPPCLDDTEIATSKDDYFTADSNYNEAIAKYQQILSGGDTSRALVALETASFYRQRMDSSAWMVWLHSALDTISYSRDTTRRWLRLHDSYNTDMRLALVYFADSLFSKAQTWLDSIEAKRNLSSDHQLDLDKLQSLINLLNGIELKSIPKSVQDSLESYSVPYTGYASTLARNILSGYGRYYAPEYRLPDAYQFGNQNLSAGPVEELIEGEDFLEFTIYPNPGDGKFTLECNGRGCSIYDVIISDILGREIFSVRQDFALNNQFEIDLQADSGVYYCTIWNGNKSTLITKTVLIQKNR
jgi:Secretion system C-terminal sorting domain/Pregnancy-associated plasma protein-A